MARDLLASVLCARKFIWKKVKRNFRVPLLIVKYSHDNRALLSPYALGGVFRLHEGGHSVLHGACDVLLDHVRAMIPVDTERVPMTLKWQIKTLICTIY